MREFQIPDRGTTDGALITLNRRTVPCVSSSAIETAIFSFAFDRVNVTPSVADFIFENIAYTHTYQWLKDWW